MNTYQSDLYIAKATNSGVSASGNGLSEYFGITLDIRILLTQVSQRFNELQKKRLK
jgi:hypothetical protein